MKPLLWLAALCTRPLDALGATLSGVGRVEGHVTPGA